MMGNSQILACLIQDKVLINRIKELVKKCDKDVKLLIFKKSEELLDKIDDDRIDLVFIDKDLAGEDFREVLQNIKNDFPYVVRILLAESWSQQLVLMTNDIVHLILEKKYLEENLNDLFIKAEKLGSLLQNKDLVKLINSFDSLPVLQPLYIELLQMIQSSDVSLKKIGELIESDISLSTRVLQVANMSVFAHIGRISSTKQAVVFLGLNVIRALILYIQVFSFDSSNSHFYKYLKQLEKHCLKVAETSKAISIDYNVNRMMQDDCFTAGLLHDIGKLVIMTKLENWEQILEHAHQSNIPVWKAENEILGTSHAEIGAYLLGVWGFPTEIIDAVAYHHKPLNSKKDFYLPLTFVHIAEAMTQAEDIIDEDTFYSYLDFEYLNKLNIKDKTINFYKNFTRKGETQIIDELDDEV
jgi:putative nucleotidyltransferase with HDIG domain